MDLRASSSGDDNNAVDRDVVRRAGPLRQMPVLQHFKEPASPAMVIHLLASKTMPRPIRATVAWMWAARLRVCEVTNRDLRGEDLLPEEFVMGRGDVLMALDGGSFSLLLRHSKGDAVNCGYVAHIMANRDGQGGLAPSSSACPVTMMQRLLASAGRRDDPRLHCSHSRTVTW